MVWPSTNFISANWLIGINAPFADGICKLFIDESTIDNLDDQFVILFWSIDSFIIELFEIGNLISNAINLLFTVISSYSKFVISPSWTPSFILILFNWLLNVESKLLIFDKEAYIFENDVVMNDTVFDKLLTVFIMSLICEAPVIFELILYI